MGWRKRKKQEPRREESPERSGSVADPALDLVGDLLRGMGEHVVDLGDVSPEAVRETFEAWARHVLVGAPIPGQPDRRVAIPLAHRSWSGARRFALEHHHREYLLVQRSLGDLRDAIWAFIHGLGEALSDDRASDALLKEQIDRVRSAVDSPSTEEIRREAIAAVGVMGRALADRQRRQRHKFEGLGARVQELRKELESARSGMERDALTQLYNRAALDEHLRRVVHLGTLFGHASCLFLVDVDHFKWVNDTFGHLAGDKVLARVGAALGRALRRREDFVGRYGGDEMAVVVAEDSPERARALGERLLEEVRALDIGAGDEALRVTASIGLAPLVPEDTVESWIERADRALYAAKQAGRDRACLAKPPRDR